MKALLTLFALVSVLGSKPATATPIAPDAITPARSFSRLKQLMPNWRTKVFKRTIRDAVQRGAVCNDGSPGVYYIRPGLGSGQQRWIIHLEGGGGCGTEADCQARWDASERGVARGRQDHQMSSDYYPSVLNFRGGIYNPSPRQNPTFGGATMVFVRYCSSDGYSDSGEQLGPWTRSGRVIVESIIEDLRDPIAAEELPDLRAAESIIFAGSSAGASGGAE